MSQRTGDPSPVAPEIWQSGFGGVDDATQRVNQFAAFPHWTGTTWQFSAKLPDPEGKYLHLNANGGHVGDDPQHAAIRRWIAPRGCDDRDRRNAGPSFQARGRRAWPGDRIAARGPLGDWVAQNAKVPTRVERHEVKAGRRSISSSTVGRDPSFDSFNWSPVIKKIAPAPAEWKAGAGFQGPPTPPLNPWEEYAQVLLLTNEFMFVD